MRKRHRARKKFKERRSSRGQNLSRMFELPEKPTVDDVIYELSKELLGPITDSKNLRALGIAQEISIGFAKQ